MQNPVSKLHSDSQSNLKVMGRTLAASLVAVALLTDLPPPSRATVNRSTTSLRGNTSPRWRT